MSDTESYSEFRIPKVAEIIAGRIRRRIVTGELAPGQNLPTEAQLIETFDVSRPTIREAIRILEFEELISVSRGSRGGAKVREQGPSFVTRAMGIALQSSGVSLGDLYRARSMIEPVAARQAALDRPVEAARTLREHTAGSHEALKTANVIPERNAEFHLLLVEQCGNDTLALVARALAGVVQRHHRLAHSEPVGDDGETGRRRAFLNLKSQEKLADLIEAGDAAGAEDHWRRHMQRVDQLLFSRVAEKSVVDVMEE
jgi:DNA-binding FadR family transcriptional regulator